MVIRRVRRRRRARAGRCNTDGTASVGLNPAPANVLAMPHFRPIRPPPPHSSDGTSLLVLIYLPRGRDLQTAYAMIHLNPSKISEGIGVRFHNERRGTIGRAAIYPSIRATSGALEAFAAGIVRGPSLSSSQWSSSPRGAFEEEEGRGNTDIHAVGRGDMQVDRNDVPST